MPSWNATGMAPSSGHVHRELVVIEEHLEIADAKVRAGRGRGRERRRRHRHRPERTHASRRMHTQRAIIGMRPQMARKQPPTRMEAPVGRPGPGPGTRHAPETGRLLGYTGLRTSSHTGADGQSHEDPRAPEGRHGSAGPPRTIGGLGAISGPPIQIAARPVARSLRRARRARARVARAGDGAGGPALEAERALHRHHQIEVQRVAGVAGDDVAEQGRPSRARSPMRSSTLWRTNSSR